MKTLLLTMCSPAYAELAAVTRPNHIAYAAARGYESRCIGIDNSAQPYGGVAGELARLAGVLAAFSEGFQQVLLHDVDVVFTNHRLTVESIAPGASGVIAREELRWWPLNFGVSIWRNTEAAIRLLTRLVDDVEIWSRYQWGVQTHLWNVLPDDIGNTNRPFVIVPARVMNSTIQPGASRWQLGDFACHLLDMPLSDRIRLAREVLQIAGPCDGTYLQ